MQLRWVARDAATEAMLADLSPDGTGLDGYYASRRWHEYGRHHGALRLADGDDRDDVLLRYDL